MKLSLVYFVVLSCFCGIFSASVVAADSQWAGNMWGHGLTVQQVKCIMTDLSDLTSVLSLTRSRVVD